MLDLEFFQLTHPGRERENNEDYLSHLASEPGRTWLFALADGVGGQERGEVASRLAVETLLNGFRKSDPDDTLTSVLPKLMQAANTQVYEAAMAGCAASGFTAASFMATSPMATTMVACALRYDRAIVAHAGDSRCYLIRQGSATSLTRDHTLAAEQLRLGLIGASEAGASQNANVLSRSLGSNLFLNVDVGEHQIFAGDLLLQCSDGLHHSVLPQDIAHIGLSGESLQAAAHALVDLANQRDGSDNISVQLIRIKSVERVGMYRGRHYKLDE